MHLNEYDTSRRFEAIVKQSNRITADDAKEDVKELVLAIDNPGFSYKVGQSIGVLVPGPHAMGHPYHFRLYTIARPPQPKLVGTPQIDLCVKRCHYIDEYSGEHYKGIASNYLCDLQPEDQITITGPYGIPFEVPEDKTANLLMIGLGTGIAPFRAFVKHIYENVGDWKGRVWLFYGPHSGLDLFYMNDKRDDFANYYDEATFQAIKALSPRPHWNESASLSRRIEEHQKEVWNMICQPNTCIYIAGHEKIRDMLDTIFNKMLDSQEKWQRKKAELVAGKRWFEIIY